VFQPVFRLKLLLTLETLFAGAYITLIKGLLFVYLVSIGSGVEGISIVVGVAASCTLIIHVLLYKYPNFLRKGIWSKFILMHGLERGLFAFIPFTHDHLLIAITFGMINCLPTATFMNLVIYGSLSEDDMKDVTGMKHSMEKR